MKYRYLGNSGLLVSEICFGVMSFTGSNGWSTIAETDQEQANRLTKIALDNGVNFFDTADIYSSGNSEEMLGQALIGERQRAIIATKVGFKMHDNQNGDGHSRKRIIEACEDSLRRMKTDYIDLYQIHSYDFSTPFEEFLSALHTLVEQGKVRYLGLSNFFAWQIVKAQMLCEIHNWSKIISLQAYYSLIGRDLEYEQIGACIDQGIGIVVWSPLHGGILSGKYRNKDNWPENTRLKNPNDHLPYNVEQGEKILDELESISKTKNISMSELSLAWTLNQPGITSVIIGARNEQQLLQNINTSEISLSNEEKSRLNEVSNIYEPYPYWYYNIFRKERMKRYFDNLEIVSNLQKENL